MRYGLAASSFESCAGVVGMAKGFGETAANLVQATRHILTEFFTEYAHPPRWYSGPAAKFDAAAFKSACKRVELMMTDAASNEMVAGQVSRGRRDVDVESDALAGAKPLFPRLKLVGRDHAHAFRRVLQKPYKADRFLDDLMEEAVLSSRSMVQIVHNSHEFREWLAEEIQLQENTDGFGARAKCLKGAKHRFESHSTPLARLLLYLPAFVAVTQRIAETRRGGSEGKRAADWLEDLGSSKLITLGMLCDAMDEGLYLIRLVDCEDVDLAEIGHHVNNFAERVVWLFDKGHCKDCGYTQYVLDLLGNRKIIVINSCRSEARRVGSAGMETDVQNALAKMKCWTKLALEVLKTEFPHYGLFNAMRIFCVSGRAQQPAQGPEGHDDDMTKRLAQVFRMNAVGLSEQLGRLRPLARKAMQNGCGSNKEAWTQVMQQTQNRASLRSSYPATDVAPVLLRFMAWQASTSGIEQNFSRIDRTQIAKTPGSPEHEIRAIRLLTSTLNPESEKKLCMDAQKLYAECCPGSGLRNLAKIVLLVSKPKNLKPEPPHPCREASRVRDAERMDKGVKRGTRSNAESQVGWVKKRRQDVQEGVDRDRQSHDLTFQDDDIELSASWGQGHDKALKFQRDKQGDYLLEAYRDNRLLEHEVTDELQAKAVANTARLARLDAALKKQRQEQERAAARNHLQLCLADYAGTSWWVDSGLPESERISAALMTHNIAILDRNRAEEERVWNADIFLVRDATDPPEPIAWVAAFLGRSMIEYSAVSSNSGLVLKLKPQFKKKLAIYLSPAFRREEPFVSSFIQQAVSHRGSKWRLAARRADADALLGSWDEVAAGRDSRWHHKADMLKEVSKLDIKASGKCGRR